MIPGVAAAAGAGTVLAPGLAPSYVRGATALGDGTDSRLTISSASCNLMLVVASQQEGISAMVPASNRGGTFTQRHTLTASQGGFTVRATAWTLEGFTANASHLINVANAVFGTIVVYGLSKPNANAVAVDRVIAPVASTDAPYPSGILAPRRASLAVALLASINYSGDGATFGVSSPFDNALGSANGSYWTCGAALRALSGAAPTAATFTNTGAPTNDATAALFNLYVPP
jgi:hypothetical protein